MNDRRVLYIILSSTITILLLYLVEQHLKVNYLFKSLSKIILFIIIPYLYIKILNKDTLWKHMKFKKDNNLRYGIILGVSSFVIVILTFMFVKDYINIADIISELENKSKINPTNFILVGLYIIFINSFLEELFFRGFVFLNLYKLGHRKLGYIFSSLLFSLYHITIFQTWFNIYLTSLALVGLITIGLIFNYVDTKSQNFLNSWIIHILADCAIIAIGIKLLGIV